LGPSKKTQAMKIPKRKSTYAQGTNDGDTRRAMAPHEYPESKMSEPTNKRKARAPGELRVGIEGMLYCVTAVHIKAVHKGDQETIAHHCR
jgi:hypothetical protein